MNSNYKYYTIIVKTLCVLIYGLLYALYLKHYIVGSDEFLMFLICKSLWIKSYNIHVKKK